MITTLAIVGGLATGLFVLWWRKRGVSTPKSKVQKTEQSTTTQVGTWTKLALQRRTQKKVTSTALAVAMVVMVVVGVFVFDPHNTTTLVKTHWQAWILLGFAAFSVGAGRQMEGKHNMGYVPGYMGFALGVLFFLGSLIKFLD